MVTTRFASRKLLSINKLNSPNQQFIKWEKVLYKHQPFPDNYTDDALFLDQLRTNVNVVKYSIIESIRGGAIVMSQVDLVVIYLVIFEFCRLEFCGSKTILLINLIICFILLSLITFYRCFYIYWQTLFTIFTFGYAFTPVIRTLTTTISTDTIWASAIILFFVSLLVHDYGMDFAPIVSTALSVNICLSASVFLISRVNCDLLAFLLLGLSLLLFCFWPQLRNVLLSQSPNTIFILLPILTIISIGVLFVLNEILTFIHLTLHFLLVGLCPKLLVRMQQWKSTIHGPWDEVTLRARHLTGIKRGNNK